MPIAWEIALRRALAIASNGKNVDTNMIENVYKRFQDVQRETGSPLRAASAS